MDTDHITNTAMLPEHFSALTSEAYSKARFVNLATAHGVDLRMKLRSPAQKLLGRVRCQLYHS